MITLAEYSYDELLPFIGTHMRNRLFETEHGSFYSRMSSDRLECFSRNPKCVECGVVGNIFLLQTTVDKAPKVKLNCLIDDCPWCSMFRRLQVQRLQSDMQGPKKFNTPHLNLFARQPSGKMILMTKDHIMPKCRGGADNISNLQTMCEKCNCRKGSMHPDEYQRMLSDSRSLAG